MAKTYVVNAMWDEEAGVWVALSDDILGLATEARTLDALLKRVTAIAPELIEGNAKFMANPPAEGEHVEIQLVSQHKLDDRHAA